MTCAEPHWEKNTCVPTPLPERGRFNLSWLLRIKSGTVGRMNILEHFRTSVWES